MTCPHCGKSANGPNYKRWHGDNCKMKGKKWNNLIQKNLMRKLNTLNRL
jgi:hypothetical protein